MINLIKLGVARRKILSQKDQHNKLNKFRRIERNRTQFIPALHSPDFRGEKKKTDQRQYAYKIKNQNQIGVIFKNPVINKGE